MSNNDKNKSKNKGIAALVAIGFVMVSIAIVKIFTSNQVNTIVFLALIVVFLALIIVLMNMVKEQS